MSDAPSYCEDVLAALALTDEPLVGPDELDGLWWDTRSRRWIVNCNDFFYWGCADAEGIEPEDLDALREAIRDAEAAGEWEWGVRLFAARKRKRAPQRPWFRDSGYTGSVHFIPESLVAAFRACGPSDE